LISSQLALNYQQQIIKQAVARNLNDQALSAAAVIPTDRVSIEEIPEEKQPVEALVQESLPAPAGVGASGPDAAHDEITVKGARNALLPQIDVLAYIGGQGLAGTYNPNCQPIFGHARRVERADMGLPFRIPTTTPRLTRAWFNINIRWK